VPLPANEEDLGELLVSDGSSTLSVGHGLQQAGRGGKDCRR
jgi:hypothetical protein